MNVMDHILFLFLFFTIFCNEVANVKQKLPKYCLKMNTIGFTVPSGDINVRYGDSLNITCNLYQESDQVQQYGEKSSSMLYFEKDSKLFLPNDKYDELDEQAERVEIINSTSIRLTIKKPEKMRGAFIHCKFDPNVRNNFTRPTRRPNLTCTNAVTVGTPPQLIEDFRCISYNLQYMKCTWTPPENFAVTYYNVSVSYPLYSTNGKDEPYKRGKDSNPTLEQYKILDAPDIDTSKMGFNLTSHSVPFYRESRETFIFYVNISNTFGFISQKIKWQHYENLLPNKPESLTGVATSPSSIWLNWMISEVLCSIKRNFIYRIIYKCEKFCKEWSIADTFVDLCDNPTSTKTTKISKSFELKNLEYAHELYDIRVSMKVLTAAEDLWSDNSSTTIRTESKKPGYPPPTTLGCFQFVEKPENKPREVYVYFQQIRPEAENGDDFQYIVESDPPLQLAGITHAYAKFSGLEEGRQYTIKIWSKNVVGASDKYSVVTIPAQHIKEPYKVWKIDNQSDKFEIVWEAPSTQVPITNYTLFWCEHKNERPHQCEGFLNWTVVPSNMSRYNVTVPPSNKVYQFAIAANTLYGSSSMLWASCTILANKTVGKISDWLIKQVGSDFIELNWKIECEDRTKVVTGYVIYYCSTNITHNDTCSSPMKNVTIEGGFNLQSGRVSHLTPYTTYLLAVSVRTKTAIGERTDFKRNTTSEAAPSTPPLNITISQITNSSFTIQWSTPQATNGKIKHYFIYCNDQIISVDGSLNNYTLTDLESYKKYVISMGACTTQCSERSKNETVQTKMGIPDQPTRLCIIGSNESFISIGWDKPNPSRGEINYYELVVYHENDNSSVYETNITNAQNFSYNFCGSETGKYNNYYINVRAVNVIDNEHYPGPWSEKFQMRSCIQNNWLIFYVLIALGVLGILAATARKVYLYCVIMQDVQVKLPDGLEADAQHSEKSSSDIPRNYDEELLLEKMSEKTPTGDSSGCSSGQESISSSVESAAHLSIDSGTDQPRNVADDNKENSLRLRNVSNKGYIPHDPTPVVNRGTRPLPAPPGNYCVIGVDPSTKAVQDTPYVSISDVETPSAPYVSTDKLPSAPPPYVTTDFFKTLNPGYVPFSHPEPASKNTGYVLAGDLTTPTVDAKTEYLLADTQVGLKSPPIWQQPLVEPSHKPGYVSVGDASPPVSVKDTGKGYVPHRQFEAKSLKED